MRESDKITEILKEYYYLDWESVDECINIIKEKLDKYYVRRENLPDEKEIDKIVKTYFPNEIDRGDVERLVSHLVKRIREEK